ncbi:MAG TPA: phosphoadenylyl-sulfate reductase [Candidatus Avipropionibacterium avicola]|uniref:Adenosine 5'-phosphosulfate reductase n=1 Tax=Candidatus Avipropionibacterium avicola TaxID=2840701 RepID=A0A9D1KP93_9ACTN|nr:phosphoadenylyl-sulfate reductase [Candidatus Avipropionibacterium avicola]
MSTAQQERRPREELRALAEGAEEWFGSDVPPPPEDAAEVLAWAAEEFGAGLAVACSMAADTVLVDLVAKARPGVDVLFLDTGYHFADTLGTRAELEYALDVTVVDVKPEQSVAEQDRVHGKDLFARDPGRCCHLRKVEPLANSLAGYDAWVTGVRRGDNPLRANTPLVSWDATHELVKINPVAFWSFDQVLAHAEANHTPINPLLAAGYPSIGCEPCTRRVNPGDDPRSGRWAGLAKTECGIHL